MIHYKKRLYGTTKNISIDTLKKLFKKEELSYIKLALLFGSRATDEFSPKSDYDIAVLTERDIDTPWGVSAKLWSDLPQALDLPEWDLDIIDLKDTSKAMLNSIEKSYILLKGDESELQRVFNGDRENCK